MQRGRATYAITGITGKVGGALARKLLTAGQPVRAVVRDVSRARTWAECGCELATAEVGDAASLTAAFEGATGVVARQTWEALFRSQGMEHPLPRIRMLDGFNEGWIDFGGHPDEIIRGKIELDTVLRELVSRSD